MNLSKYYDTICKTPLLSKQEEEQLFTTLNNDTTPEDEKQSIRDTITKANLRFVFKQARYFSDGDPEVFQELISAGNEGLLKSIPKFTLDKGWRFMTYAGFWINQKILYEMSKMRIVALPVWKQQLGKKLQKLVESNPDFTIKEVSELFPTVSKKDLQVMLDFKFLTFYIEDLGAENPCFEINPIEDEVDKNILNSQIHSKLDNLPEVYRQVLELYFGFNGDEKKNIKDIAEILELPLSKAKAIKVKALKLMKAQLKERDFSLN